MRLTDEERAWLAGEGGPGLARAMEILTALGRIFEAPDLVPVRSAQVSGVSYRNIGEAGLEFLTDWADQGDRARIPAFMNPGGMDRVLWRELGIPEEFHRKQLEVIHQLERLGTRPLLSCAPYHVVDPPDRGDHLAWAESSAVSYANSVLGARTNREGGPAALAAALAGRTPRYGLHCRENRQASLRVRVEVQNLSDPSDFGALGAWVGAEAGGSVVLLEGTAPPRDEPRRTACLKALGAAMAASGAVGLYHWAGVTPEAMDPKELPLHPEAATRRLNDLEAVRRRLGASRSGPVDLVALGCPHVSLEELRRIAGYLAGRRLRARLWITTSREVREQAEVEGLAEKIRQTGGLIVADTCVVVAPLAEMGVRSVATDSAKAAIYIPSHHKLPVAFGPLERCLEAAESGRWKD